MRILVSLTHEYTSANDSSAVALDMHFADGKSNLTTGSVTYYANTLSQLPEIEKSVNLYEGGDVEDRPEVSISLVYSSLLDAYEDNGYNLNGAVVTVSIYDGEHVTPIYRGTVANARVNHSEITLTLQTFNEKMKTLEAPLAFGYNSKFALPRDTTIAPKTVSFSVGGVSTIHPKLVSVTSTKCPQSSASDYNGGYNYGVQRIYQSSGKDTLVISYASSITYTNFKHLKLKFVSGANVDKIYRIYSITESGDSTNGYTATIVLKDTLSAMDVRRFDRLKLYEGVSYYRLPDNIDASSLYRVNAKTSSGFVSLGSGAWNIEEINGKNYVAFYPSNNVYRKIPAKVVISSDDSTYLGGTVTPPSGDYRYPSYTSDPTLGDCSNLYDGDLSSFWAGCPQLSASHNSYTLTYFDLYPSDLSTIKEEILVGGTIDGGGTLGTVKFICNTILKSGEVYPCTNNAIATADISTAMLSYTAGTARWWNGTPSGDTSDANISNETKSRIYSDANTWTIASSTYDNSSMAFNPEHLYKVDVDSDAYQDISCIRVTLYRSYYSDTVQLGAAIRAYEIGLYIKNEIEDEQENVYIDCMGNGICPSVYAQKLLTYLGATTTATGQDTVWSSTGGAEVAVANNSSAFYTYGGNFCFSYATGDSGESSLDILSGIAKENLLVLSQLPSGVYDARHLDTSLDPENTFNDDNILGISSLLQNVSLENLINLPTFTFKGLDELEYSLTVKSLTETFPTRSEFTSDNSVMSRVYSLSEGFLDMFFESITITPYYFLKSLWDICKASYVAHGVLQSGSITVQTIYLDLLDGLTSSKDALLNLMAILASKRKEITIEAPLNYSTVALGSRVSIKSSAVLGGKTLLGFVNRVAPDLKAAKVSIGCIIDTIS